MKLHCDFETRSTVDLKRAGLHVYAEHASTRVLCMSYAFGDAAPRTWRPGLPFPRDVLEHVAAGGIVAAHNAAFEIAIWNGPLQRQLINCPHGLCDNNCQHCGIHGGGVSLCFCSACFPVLTPEQADCTMARALALSLPGALDDLAPALRLPIRKDKRGRYLIQKLCKPQKRRDGTVYWIDDAFLLAELYAYCEQDVRTEQAIDPHLLPLSESEKALWVLDQRINGRGVRIDLPNVKRALEIADAEGERTALEVRSLTGGIVASGSQVAKLKDWLAANGVKAGKLTKTQVSALIRDNPDAAPEVRRVLALRQESSKASVAKLKAMLQSVNSDGRARGLFQYHGAGTGRWAGRRIQLQNMPRSPDEFTPSIAAMLIECFGHARAADLIRVAFGAPMEQISFALRSMLTADEGHELHAADFSNIEGRVLAWLADEEWKLDAFRDYDAGTGHDLYKIAYGKSFGIAPEAVTKSQRQLGKVQELALGYGGGIGAFASMAANYGIWVGADLENAPADAAQKLSHEQADDIKRAWRDAHPRTVGLWYELDRAARRAIERAGAVVTAAGGKIAYRMHSHFLLCRLPSGRVIAYPFARIEPAHDFETRAAITACKARLKELQAEGRGELDELVRKWLDKLAELNRRPKTDNLITYDGFNSQTHKWGAENTYSGKLAENVTQAVARDVLSDSMHRLEAAGYRIVLHVHDENVCEMPRGKGSLDEMSRIMGAPPAWAPTLPIAVDGWTGERYRK